MPAWTAGCSLAVLSSPSTTLMARSSSTSACRVAVAPASSTRGACISCVESTPAVVLWLRPETTKKVEKTD